MAQPSALFRVLAQQQLGRAFPGLMIPPDVSDENIIAALEPAFDAQTRRNLKNPTFARTAAERAVGGGPPTKASQIIPGAALRRQNKVEASRRPFGVAAALDQATMVGLRQEALETLLRGTGAKRGGVRVTTPRLRHARF